MKIIDKLNQEAQEEKVKKFICKFLTFKNDSFNFDTMFLDYINPNYLKEDYSKPLSNRERPITVIKYIDELNSNPYLEVVEVEDCSIKVSKKNLNPKMVSSLSKIPTEEWMNFIKENYQTWMSMESHEEEMELIEKMKRENEEKQKNSSMMSIKKVKQGKKSVLIDKFEKG